MAARHRKVPGILAWLGLVSYSVYLLHPLLIEVYARVSGTMKPHPFPVQVALAAGFVLVLLGCSALTYRLIEAPMQRHGRWLARRLDARFGEDSVERPLGDGRPLPAKQEIVDHQDAGQGPGERAESTEENRRASRSEPGRDLEQRTWTATDAR
jgi:hypothetical protein